MALRFPDAEWFLALGRRMAAQGELFRRIGYADTRFVVRVLPDEEGCDGERDVGLAMTGYALTHAEALAPAALASFDPDCTICARESVWRRMLDEIAREKAGAIKVAKVNVDDNQSLSSKYNIRAIPALLFFKNGQLRDQVVGVTCKKDLLSRLEALR